MFWAYPGQWGGPEQQGRGPSIVALWRTLYVVDTGVNLFMYLLRNRRNSLFFMAKAFDAFTCQSLGLQHRA